MFLCIVLSIILKTGLRDEMMNVFWKKIRKNAGFTLIELILVIVILGILAVIAIPSYSQYTDQAKQATDKQTASIAVNAMVMYCLSNNITNFTDPINSSDKWKSVLNSAGLWVTADQTLQSAYYSGITLYGPVDGVCTVTLEGAVDYVISKQ